MSNAEINKFTHKVRERKEAYTLLRKECDDNVKYIMEHKFKYKKFAIKAYKCYTDYYFNSEYFYNIACVFVALDNNIYTRKQIITLLCFLCANQYYRFGSAIERNLLPFIYLLLSNAPDITAHELTQVFIRTHEKRKKEKLLRLFEQKSGFVYELAQCVFGARMLHEAQEQYNAIMFAKQIT